MVNFIVFCLGLNSVILSLFQPMLCYAMLCYAMLFVTVNFREVMEANPAVGKKVFRSVIGQKKIMNIQYTVHI